MTKQKAEDVVSIRLPKGMKDELRAATGQKVSTLTRWVLTALLEKRRAERRDRELANGQNEVQDIVAAMPHTSEIQD